MTVSEVWQARRDAPDLSELAVLTTIDKCAIHSAIILYKGKIWYRRAYNTQPELRVRRHRVMGKSALVLRFASSDRRDLKFRTRSVIGLNPQLSRGFLTFSFSYFILMFAA